MNNCLIREQQGSLFFFLLFFISFPPQLAWVLQLFSSGATYLQTSKKQQIRQAALLREKITFPEV